MRRPSLEKKNTSSTNASANPPASRRERPAKAPLSRERIVETALAVMAEEGLGGLSLRKVAAALDTGPASLYVYVDNLDALHAWMLDSALVEMPLARSSKKPWREQLVLLLTAYTRTLMEHPGLGQLAMRVVAGGNGTLRLHDALLGIMLEGGMDGARAAWAVDLLTLYCSAIAAEQDVRREQESPLHAIGQALDHLDADAFPHLFAWRREMVAGEGRARLRWGLEVLINGLMHTPRS